MANRALVRTSLTVFALVLFTQLLAGSRGYSAEGDIVYSFVDGRGTQGWGKAWGEFFDQRRSAVEFTTDLVDKDHGGALRVNAAFKGGVWEEVNIGAWLTGKEWEKFDLTDFESISYEVYFPVNMADGDGEVKLSTALDKEWAQIGPNFEPYSFNSMTRVNIGGRDYFKVVKSDVIGANVNRTGSGVLILRVAGYHLNYVGPIYYNNITIHAKRDGIVLKTPRRFDVVRGATPISFRIPVFGGNLAGDEHGGGAQAYYSVDGAGNYALSCERDNLCAGSWDSVTVNEGFHKLAFSYRDDSNHFVQKETEVFVRNLPLAIKLSSQQMGGLLRFTITGGIPDAVNVTMAGSGQAVAAQGGDGSYEATLSFNGLADVIYPVTVSATLGNKTTQEVFEVVNNQTLARNGGIVRRLGYDFVVGGKPVKFYGFNAYDLPFKKENRLLSNQKAWLYDERGELLPTLLAKDTVINYEEMVDRVMDEASKIGFTVMRTWAFNSDLSQTQFTFYNQDWTLSEGEFRRFDYLMASAARHGIRVIVVFENYWSTYGGLPTMVKKFGLNSPIDWYSHADAQQMYRNYITAFVGRINSYSGIKYQDDATVFAWELMNEPRMGIGDDKTPDKSAYDKDGSKLGAWFASTAAFIKSMDANHMVATGSEGRGFQNFGATDEGYGADPLKVMDQPGIDFFTLHYYPNSAGIDYDLDSAKRLLCDYTKAATARGKPVMLEEWSVNGERPLKVGGQTLQPSDPMYSQMRRRWLDELLTTFDSCGGKANLFWMLQLNQQDSEYGANVFTPADLVTKDKPLIQVLRSHAHGAGR